MFILFPIAYPLSYFVQRLLGSHQGLTYKRNELKELVALLTDSQLTNEEVTIINGVLGLIEKKPEEIMIPLEDVFMLEGSTLVTRSLLALVSFFFVFHTKII